MESTHNEAVAAGSRPSRMGRGVGFGTMLAISCLISYWLITNILAREYSVSRDNDLLGGMWAVIATILCDSIQTSPEQSRRDIADAGDIP